VTAVERLTAGTFAAAVPELAGVLCDAVETDSAAETLYRSTGWECYGVVPGYAADPGGMLRDCSFYVKRLAVSHAGAPPPR
jgi:hypothetical protein